MSSKIDKNYTQLKNSSYLITRLNNLSGFFIFVGTKKGIMMVNDQTVLHEQKDFDNVDFVGDVLRNREFIKCTFKRCNFTKSDLRGNDFEDCVFQECNLSMANIEGAGLRNISFKDCKLVGIDFTKCNLLMYSFKFEKCIMDYCTFYGTKLKKTDFIECSLKEVDFAETDLLKSKFTLCDLTGALFSNCNLSKVDFSTAVNFAIDPQYNNIKDAKFSSYNLRGLLYRYQINVIDE